MQQNELNELNHYDELCLVKMDIISLLCLLFSYNKFYLVIMNYWPYGLPYEATCERKYPTCLLK